MKFKVDKESCIGCGFCASVCPEVFKVGEDEKAVAYAEPTENTFSSVQDAAAGCPVAAIGEE